MSTRTLFIASAVALAALGCRDEPTAPQTEIASRTSIRRVDMYDPATNTWVTRRFLPTPRMNAGGATLGGKLYIVGGRSGTAYLSTVEVYDPAANTWTSRPATLTARAALGVGAVSGAIYAMGGRNATAALATNERFSP